MKKYDNRIDNIDRKILKSQSRKNESSKKISVRDIPELLEAEEA
jgi:hypothetical protein